MFKIWVLAAFLHASPVDPTIAAFKHLEQLTSLKECTAALLNKQKELPDVSLVCIAFIPKGPQT